MFWGNVNAVDGGIGSMVIRSFSDGENCGRFLPAFSGPFSCELRWVRMELQSTKRLEAGAVVKALGIHPCGTGSIAVLTSCLSWVCWFSTLLWQFLLCIFRLLDTPSSHQNQRVILLILQTSFLCFKEARKGFFGCYSVCERYQRRIFHSVGKL